MASKRTAESLPLGNAVKKTDLGKNKKGQARINKIVIQSLLAQGYLVRMLMFAVMNVIMVLATLAFVTAVKEEGTRYHQMTKGKKGHGLGSPVPHLTARGLAFLSTKQSPGWD